MTSIKEIRQKIRSIKSTQKITYAMGMVAASKMRKAQNRMLASRPYNKHLCAVINHLLHANLEYSHPYMRPRIPKRISFIVVTTDRGLCGGLNNTLFKATITAMKQAQEAHLAIDIYTIGVKAQQFFHRIGKTVIANITHLGDVPVQDDLVGLLQLVLEAYDSEKIDQVFIVYNEFISTMSQVPRIKQLLPVQHIKSVDNNLSPIRKNWDYIYEPAATELIDGLLYRYASTMLYQAVVENIACEQAARMLAMRSATDNANTLIGDFQLLYNKARQAMITKELSEIVSGAQAV